MTPASTNCIAAIAVSDFETDPTRKTVRAGSTGIPRSRFASPAPAAYATRPSRTMRRTAPGLPARCRSASISESANVAKRALSACCASTGDALPTAKSRSRIRSAVGIALISRFKTFTRSFDAALFGNILGVSQSDVIAIIVVTVVTLSLVLVAYKQLLFTTFEPEVAKFYGIRTGWIDAMFSLLLAAVIVVSMQILGVTMLAAAIVIPPIIARLLTNSFGKMMLSSIGIGAFCGLGGIYISFFVDVSSGATVVLFSAALFVIVLAYTSIRQRIAVYKGKRMRQPMPALQDSHMFD